MVLPLFVVVVVVVDVDVGRCIFTWTGSAFVVGIGDMPCLEWSDCVVGGLVRTSILFICIYFVCFCICVKERILFGGGMEKEKMKR